MYKFLLFLFSITLLIPHTAEASHAMGCDLKYTYIGKNGTGQMQYQVTLSFYRDCSGISAPTSVIVDALNVGCGSSASQSITLNKITTDPCAAGGVSGTNGCEVSQLCPSQLNQSTCASPPGPYTGVRKLSYTGVLTLPSACSQWLLTFAESARNTSTNLLNSSSSDLYVEAIINNAIDPNTGTNYTNSSVAFGYDPVPFVCQNYPVFYNNGASEIDGDSLVYKLVQPLGATNTPIAYSAGYSLTNPIKTAAGNFSFNQSSGQLNFTPSATEVDVVTIKVEEYRNGVLVGSTMRDIQVTILNCIVSTPSQGPISNINNGTAQDSVSLQVCPNTQATFDVVMTDPNGRNITIKSNVTASPSPLPGATLTTIGTGDTVTARIVWTPTIADTGCVYFTLTTETDDCPIKGNFTRPYKVCVLNKVTVTPHTSVYCGTPIQLKATGGSNFSWFPTAGLTPATGSISPLAAPSVDTKYTFTSDCGTDTALVLARPPFAMDAGAGGSICKNGQLQLNATVANTFAPYQIKWVPSAGLKDPLTGAPNDTSLNPVAQPAASTTYYCYFTASNGCVRYDSVKVDVTGTAPAVIAGANPRYICPGTPVTLTVIGNPASCGLSPGPCVGSTVTGQVGTGSTIQGGGGSIYPSPYGNAKKSARHQYLIRASELKAVLGAGGKITSISLDIGTSNGGASVQNFYIKMACTSVDSITGFEPVFAQVYDTSALPAPVAGWNVHNLKVPYDWDGVSNLIVDICFNSISKGAINPKMRYTPTPYRSCWMTVSDVSNMCGVTGTPPSPLLPGAYYNRPNFKFTICHPTLDNYTILWTPNTGPNAANPSNKDTTFATPVGQQKYLVSVTDNGCTGNDFVTIFVDTNLTLAVNPDTFICNLVPVQLRTTVKGSPLPGNQFTYTWTSNPTGSAPPSGAGAGFANPIVNPTVTTLYTCVVTGGSCTLTDTARVTVGTSLPVNLLVDSISCNNFTDGKVKAVLTGGVAPITYVWSSGGGNVDSIKNLAPNTYSVTATDSKGCAGSATAILSNPTLLTVVLDSVNVSCFGAGDGKITATVSGGRPTYVYTWSGGAANNPALNLSPANYLLTVTDSKGCTVTASKNIQQPAILTSVMVVKNVTANGGSDGRAKVTASGGTQPYTYLWSTGETIDSIKNKVAGTYYVTICDKNNCCIKDTAVIKDPPPIVVVTGQVDNPCSYDSKGTLWLDTAYGGVAPYTYVWSTGSSADTIYNLPPADYYLTITDANNVSVVEGPYTITAPTAIAIQIDSVSITCFGANNGSLIAIASGGTSGYNYDWNIGGVVNPNTGLAPGNYIVTVTDANFCTASASIGLGEPTQVTAMITNTDSVKCFGDSNGLAEVMAMGGTPGYSYVWSGSASTSTIANDLNAGPHSVTVTDARGCAADANFVIDEPLQIGASVTPFNAHCESSNDGGASVVVSNGTPSYSYAWDGTAGGNSINTLAAGQHTLIVTDVNGCTVSQSFAVDTDYVLHTSIVADSAKCFGAADGNATVTALNGTPNYQYLWNPSNQSTATAASIPAAIYVVTVTDNYGCIATNTIEVGQPTQVVLVTDKQDPACAGYSNGKAWVAASGGNAPFSFRWANSYTDTSLNLIAGTYTVTATDNYGCTVSQDVTLVDPPSLNASLDATPITCANADDGKATVTVNGGTPPISFAWNNGLPSNASVDNLAPAVYSVTVSDSRGCDTVLNVAFVSPAPIEFTDVKADSVSCPKFTDGKILVEAIGGTPGTTTAYQYSLDGITYQSQNIFTNLASGSYRVFVKDGQGCVKDTIVKVEQPNELIVTVLPQDSTIELGSSLKLFTNTGGYDLNAIHSYSWTPVGGLSCIDCVEPTATPYYDTEYRLDVNYLGNCIATTTVKINVNNGPDFYMPNAFSPNGNGNNDVLLLFGSGIKTVDMKIFNRWGEKVFDSNNQWTGWDGTYKGALQPPGVYTFVVVAEYLNGKKKQKNGSITLIR